MSVCVCNTHTYAKKLLKMKYSLHRIRRLILSISEFIDIDWCKNWVRMIDNNWEPGVEQIQYGKVALSYANKLLLPRINIGWLTHPPWSK